jgi:hypothetical protein
VGLGTVTCGSRGLLDRILDVEGIFFLGKVGSAYGVCYVSSYYYCCCRYVCGRL